MPDSVDANRYQYGDANPLTVTDPSGHGWWSSAVSAVKQKASSAWSSTTSFVSQSYSAASSYVSYRWQQAQSVYYQAKAAVLHGVSYVAKKAGFKGLAGAADRGRKRATRQSQEHHRRAVKAHEDFVRKGAAIKARVVRAVRKAVKVVKDASHNTVKWVKEHKKQIIAVVAVVATIAATVALGPVGAVVAGIAINIAKDAASGDIHSWSDLGMSVASAAITGTLGALTGGLGAYAGRLAGQAACKLGAGLLGKVAAGALSGGVSGGVSDASMQFATTGRVNLSETTRAAAEGAVIGGITGGRATCHSFDPRTRVVLADGSTKPIGEIKLGDKVLATDPKTGKTEAKPVSVLHHNHDSDLADVTVKDKRSGKTTVLHTTWHHPFWNAGKNDWTEAQDLKAGDKLRSPDGETTQTVTAVKVWTGLKWMQDLTVNDDHTYYVLAGTTAVLVHNNTKRCDLPSPDEANIPRHSARKTAATSDGGTSFQLSGWSNRMPKAFSRVSTSDTAAQREGFGLEPRPNGNDNGVPGQYYDSHAEPQAYTNNPGGDIVVDRDPCGSCQEFLTGAAVHNQRSIKVSHPGGVTVFHPTGDMEFNER